MNATTVLPADWQVVPEDESAGSPPAGDVLDAIARTCRQRVVRRALFAAGVAMVPVPGLDSRVRHRPSGILCTEAQEVLS